MGVGVGDGIPVLNARKWTHLKGVVVRVVAHVNDLEAFALRAQQLVRRVELNGNFRAQLRRAGKVEADDVIIREQAREGRFGAVT